MTDTREQVDLEQLVALDTPWAVVVWDDPVNLMSYVSYVFRSYFGFDRETAERLMLQVHNTGRSVVATGTREDAERHTEAMHDYGLWASIERTTP
jgi:ATP-dependent Clp protease adaptor protein ClpS